MQVGLSIYMILTWACRRGVIVVFPSVCLYLSVCLFVTTWSPQLQDRATLWAYQQKAAAENNGTLPLSKITKYTWSSVVLEVA